MSQMFANQIVATKNGGPLPTEISEQFRADLIENFGFVLGSTPHIPSARVILKNYNTYMDMQVGNGRIAENDVLRPVIVIHTPSGAYVARNIGDSLPLGSQPDGTVLPADLYLKFLSKGQLPVGDFRLSPTGAPTFVHDLGHLSGFRENLGYMRLVRQYATAYTQGLIPASLSRRGYFFNESLFIIPENSKTTVLDKLALAADMRRNYSQASVQDMSAFLATMSVADLIKLAGQVSELLINSKTVAGLGGAAREPFSGSFNVMHDPLTNIKSDLTGAILTSEKNQLVTGIARAQVLLLRLLSVTIQDWYEAVTVEKIAADSPVGRLFASGVLSSRPQGHEPAYGDLAYTFGYHSVQCVDLLEHKSVPH